MKKVKFGKGFLRVIAATPSLDLQAGLLFEFSKTGGGVVSTLDQPLVRALANLVEANDDVKDNLEWVGFGELIGKICGFCGLTSISQADNDLTRKAIAKVCSKLPEDGRFGASAAFEGFHKAIQSVLEDLYAFGINSNSLLYLSEKAAEKRDDGGVLAEKLSLISEIGEGTEGLLRAIGREWNSARISRFLAFDGEIQAELGRWFLVLGGSPSSQDISAILKLAELGAEVWVVAERELGDTGLFLSLAHLNRILGSSAVANQEAGTWPRIANSLFQNLQAPVQEPVVQVLSAPDTLREVEYIFRQIAEKIRQGQPESDFSIYARNIETYGPLLSLASHKFGLKVKMSRRVELLSIPLAKYLKQAMLALTSHDVRDLIFLLKSSYSRLKARSISDLIESIHTARSDGANQWEALLESAKQSEDLAWLVAILEWRSECYEKPLTKAEWVSRFQVLGDLIPWQTGLPEQESVMTDRDNRAGYAMQHALNQHTVFERVEGETELAFREAANWMVQEWENTDVSIPSDQEGITVCTNASTLKQVPFVFAIGLSEGVFPRSAKEDPILSDDEKKFISEAANLPFPLPNSQTMAREEREELVRLVMAAKHSLTLSLSVSDDEKTQIQAAYVGEIRRITSAAIVTIPREVSFDDQLVSGEKPGIDDPDYGIQSQQHQKKVRQFPPEFEDLATKESWFVGKSTPVSPRQIRQASECGFKSFAKNRLKLKGHAPSEFSSEAWFGLISLPQKANLALQESKESATKALWREFEIYLDRQKGLVSPAEVTMLQLGVRRLITGWVNREFASKALWSKYKKNVSTNVHVEDMEHSVFSDQELEGTFAASFEFDYRRGIQLYEWSAPDNWKIGETGSKIQEKDLVYYSILGYIAARSKQFVLEIDAANSEKRSLILMPRGTVDARVDSENGLRTEAPLNKSSAPTNDFFKLAQRPTLKALKKIQTADVSVTPGDWCKTCQFGELCRSSQTFGETDLSLEQEIDTEMAHSNINNRSTSR